ncbi:hypothetical protein RchiOBHm_Chr1g0332911 [Rosa chinensis]|uniref:Uncharacterized protein n=1 Tax=Rosa chinensis TaxID=74649 RepID=A0A2P6SBW4_ROSCH|nr:hypothetical protein RchiOBHm_Chr1g0332911 [Rosa chinensis]
MFKLFKQASLSEVSFCVESYSTFITLYMSFALFRLLHFFLYLKLRQRIGNISFLICVCI